MRGDEKLIGAIDQGTSSSRFLLFNLENGEVIAHHQIEVKQLFPNPGWVEMDPNEIVDTVVKCINVVCNQLENLNVHISQIKCVGITNQRETTVLWDRETGEPLCNAIVWLDSRTTELAKKLSEKTPDRSENYFKHKTGLPINPYFSALKLRWAFENIPAIDEAKRKGTLMFGTVDSWLLWKLTGEHLTDVSNASRTLLLDLKKVAWSTELCKFFDIPMQILPRICSSAEVYAHFNDGLLKGVPISGCLGDQQAAMVGHQCLQPGDSKNTYGTGTFMLCNIGYEPLISNNGLLTTVGFQFGKEGRVCYALEGSGSIGGNAVRFLRDSLSFIKKASEVEALAGSVSDTGGVMFVPCFTGLYSPYWDSSARGTILGLAQSSSKAHIARAALEAVCFQTAEMIEAVEKDMKGKHKVAAPKIDGGMTANHLFNQMQSDILGKEIICSKLAETTAWGAAVAAAIGIGLLSLEQYAEYKICEATIYSPKSTEEKRSEEMKRWREAVKRARNWAT
uniref:Probable glycerol kinase n=1 Tax=Ascaris suum TaxID=6253 RepID=F1L477_ASCSU